MNVEEIQEYNPHRYPFLLVDRVVEIELGVSIRGYKNVTFNEPFFQGHFPGHAVMPGVLMIEAMAQLAGVLAFRTAGKKVTDGVLYYLASIDNTRFRRLVVPGDRLDMHARVISNKRRVIKFVCEASVGDEIACSSDILCVERPM
jgi:3-hydroxyacyl-[acyl-carrier-protein] dehydratase